MLEWISENSALVNGSTSLVMAAIWAAYLQLFYFTFRRQRQPTILVNRAAGTGKDGHCLISNMSADPVYVLCILAVLEDDGRSWVCTVTDDEDVSKNSGSTRGTHQGPLSSGGFMDIGPFEEMIRRTKPAEKSEAGAEESFTAIEIKVIASYGMSRKFVGATRRFARTEGDDWALRPTSLETEQLSGFRARRRLKRLLREHL